MILRFLYIIPIIFLTHCEDNNGQNRKNSFKTTDEQTLNNLPAAHKKSGSSKDYEEIITKQLANKQKYIATDWLVMMKGHLLNDNLAPKLRFRAFDSLPTEQKHKYVYELLLSCSKHGCSIQDVMNIHKSLPYDSLSSKQATLAIYQILKKDSTPQDLLDHAHNFQTGDLEKFLEAYVNDNKGKVTSWKDVKILLDPFENSNLTNVSHAKIIDAAKIAPDMGEILDITATHRLPEVTVLTMLTRTIDANKITAENVLSLARDESFDVSFASNLMVKHSLRNKSAELFIKSIVNDQYITTERKKLLIRNLTNCHSFDTLNIENSKLIGSTIQDEKLQSYYYQQLSVSWRGRTGNDSASENPYNK